MQNEILVHIIGSGHSGSTLLDMLLGGHSKISSLGESPFVRWNTNNHTEMDVCTCGNRLMDCPFWSQVDLALREIRRTPDTPALPALKVADDRVASLRNARGVFVVNASKPYPYRSRLNEISLVLGSKWIRALSGAASSEVAMNREIGQNMGVLYRAVRMAHGTPIIVDSTKNPGTFKNVYMETPERDMRLILLVRDGRAVTCSRMRRENTPMATSARIWRAEHLKRMAAEATMSGVKRKVVHYEDLAADPKRVLRDLCNWLGIAFELSMFDYRENTHNVGGNPMRFRREEKTIQIDERWREELSEADLAEFDRIAGWLNRRLGY